MSWRDPRLFVIAYRNHRPVSLSPRESIFGANTYNTVADTASWIVGIALVARDDVHVGVHHGLPGCHAHVDADVVAIGFALGVECRSHALDERPDVAPFVIGAVEDGGHMAARHDQRASVGSRHSVLVRECGAL